MPKTIRRKEKELNHRIILSLDFGASLTKGIFQVGLNKKIHVLSMEPEIAFLTPESVTDYVKNKFGYSHPENSAWIGYNSKFMAVGYLATRFFGDAGLKQLKYEKAVYKTLAAIWVVTQKLALKNPYISVCLSVLLPSDEYEDRKRFELLVKRAMENFLTPTGEIKAKLIAFNCKPEGTGVYLAFRQQSQQDFESLIVSVVMMGYRNTSLLSCFKGQFNPGITSDLGFVRLIEAVKSKTSGLDEKMAAGAIAKASSKIDPSFLVRLCRSTSDEGRAEDLRMITTAIKESRRLYFQNIQTWIDTNLYPNTDILIFTGGTSEYLRQCLDLTEYYKLKGIKVFWHTDWGLEFEEISNLIKKEDMPRYFDVCSFFMYFVDSYLPSQGNRQQGTGNSKE